MTKTIMDGDPEKTERLRLRISQLDKEKSRLLTENRIPVDYMDIRYNCPICQDTGMTKDGDMCSCYSKIARLAAD